jgi:hypothetical protein
MMVISVLLETMDLKFLSSNFYQLTKVNQGFLYRKLKSKILCIKYNLIQKTKTTFLWLISYSK